MLKLAEKRKELKQTRPNCKEYIEVEGCCIATKVTIKISHSLQELH